jgi:2'-5' RNA ligase
VPGGFAVELFFDADGDAAVRRVWQQIGGPVLASPTARPHITLAVYGQVEPEPFAAALADWAASARPLDLHLASIGVFPGEARVLFFAPVVTAELLELHRGFHVAFERRGHESWPLYAPGRWVPHCTLAMEIDSAALHRGLDAARAAPLPIPVRLSAVGLVEFRPVVERAVVPLGAVPQAPAPPTSR